MRPKKKDLVAAFEYKSSESDEENDKKIVPANLKKK